MPVRDSKPRRWSGGPGWGACGTWFLAHGHLRWIFTGEVQVPTPRPQRGWDLRAGPRSRSGSRVLAPNQDGGCPVTWRAPELRMAAEALLPRPPRQMEGLDSPGIQAKHMRCWGHMRIHGRVADATYLCGRVSKDNPGMGSEACTSSGAGGSAVRWGVRGGVEFMKARELIPFLCLVGTGRPVGTFIRGATQSVLCVRGLAWLQGGKVRL